VSEIKRIVNRRLPWHVTKEESCPYPNGDSMLRNEYTSLISFAMGMKVSTDIPSGDYILALQFSGMVRACLGFSEDELDSWSEVI
jgi:hypothetical protein